MRKLKLIIKPIAFIIIFAFQTQWADSILKNGLAFVKL